MGGGVELEAVDWTVTRRKILKSSLEGFNCSRPE